MKKKFKQITSIILTGVTIASLAGCGQVVEQSTTDKLQEQAIVQTEIKERKEQLNKENVENYEQAQEEEKKRIEEEAKLEEQKKQETTETTTSTPSGNNGNGGTRTPVPNQPSQGSGNKLSMVNLNKSNAPAYNAEYQQFWNDIVNAYNTGEYKNYPKTGTATTYESGLRAECYIFPYAKDSAFISGFYNYLCSGGIKELSYQPITMLNPKYAGNFAAKIQEDMQKEKSWYKGWGEFEAKYKYNGEWLQINENQNFACITFEDIGIILNDNKKIESAINNMISSLGLNRNTTERDAAIAINNYICKKVSYDYSYKKGDLMDAINGSTVCQGYALYFQLLCKGVGLECRYIAGNTANASHAWNSVKINGQWLYVDTTWNDSSPANRYLLISEAQMRKDHFW